MALLSESHFFEQRSLDSLLRTPFDVGLGVEIAGAPPDHRSGSTGPDNGAIPRLRRIRNAKRTHSTSDDLGALFDWTTTGQPRFIHLLGHGAGGLFDVGDGQTRITESGCLHAYNDYYWTKHMERTSKYDENRRVKVPANDVLYSGGLLLEGCCVADGVDGIHFMKKLADTTLRTVFAFTGLITVHERSVWFEKGHAWMRQDPLASSATVEVRQLDKGLVRHSSVASTGLGEGTEPTDIEALEITSLLHGNKTTTLTAEQASTLISQLFYSNGFKPEGEAAGIVTHRFRITYRGRAPLAVDLYARRLALTDAGIAYLVGPELVRLLATLFPS
jgi:hypothetical protein